MVDVEVVDESEEVHCTTRLKEGLVLKELINDLTTEFSLDASKAKDVDVPFSETRIDKCYEYNEFAPYINLDCIQIDPNDDNPSSAPFDKFHQKMSNVIEDGGVKKITTRPGTGNVVPKNAVVYVHYNSYLEMEEVPFDTSYLRCPKPNRIQLGTGSVYSGFEISVSTMKKGEKAQFLVQPEYAFGKMGAPPRIPPNAVILLEIELLNFIDCGNVFDTRVMSNDDKKKFAAAYKAAKSFHALGNDYFAHKNLAAAAENYRKAENLLTGCFLNSDEEEVEQKKLLMKVYVNLCICYNDTKMRMPEKVCIMAREATLTSPKEAKRNAKLQYNWGKALLVLNDFKKATEHFKQALAVEPNNTEISSQLKILEQKKKKYYQHEKISYKKAFGFSTPKNKQQTNPDSADANNVESVNAEFEKLVREQIKEFAESNQGRLQLPSGFTQDEKTVVQKIASEYKLILQEHIVSGANILALIK